MSEMVTVRTRKLAFFIYFTFFLFSSYFFNVYFIVKVTKMCLIYYFVKSHLAEICILTGAFLVQVKTMTYSRGRS